MGQAGKQAGQQAEMRVVETGHVAVVKDEDAGHGVAVGEQRKANRLLVGGARLQYNPSHRPIRTASFCSPTVQSAPSTNQKRVVLQPYSTIRPIDQPETPRFADPLRRLCCRRIPFSALLRFLLLSVAAVGVYNFVVIVVVVVVVVADESLTVDEKLLPPDAIR